MPLMQRTLYIWLRKQRDNHSAYAFINVSLNNLVNLKR
ncbi:hypothetical protein ACVNPX_10470 [Staphylococcus aureus]